MNPATLSKPAHTVSCGSIAALDCLYQVTCSDGCQVIAADGLEPTFAGLSVL
jgi:hypothetical protein